jgi:peptidoglycan/xylan/chitin deacetylase (PgdA/CDA1 family)
MAMRAEISTCRDRILAETGDLPVSFAYPNGGADDYTRESLLLVREAGFKCACTTISGRVDQHASMFQLPRYGSPESVWEAEATVSGAFETLKDWRRSCLKAMSMI